ncbi:hypothetical protein [Shouchella lehensis]|uniref:Uncharacterized protein n=1 Tax=Shouchella lehensis TaxID=300825 RepID=A0A4Y7WFX6_9BACI|nr:hypothetical protein [Shouchella lehensis]MBG9784970.1 hypothetical protein [Shouchella lehensis]TES46390.1 hypothetical protein E2L03_16975 [Shouchella lehensis]
MIEVARDRLFQYFMKVFHTAFIANVLGQLLVDATVLMEWLTHLFLVALLVALAYTFGVVKVKDT